MNLDTHQDVVRVSPSQLETFKKCPRLWFLENVDGERESEEDAPEYRKQGKRVHAVIEWYLGTGNIPTAQEFELVHGPGSWVEDHHGKGRRLVAKAIEKGLLPHVSADLAAIAARAARGIKWFHPSELLVEHKIEEVVIARADGSPVAWLLGYCDLLWEDDVTMHVDDHKTTTDFDRNKTPQQLVEDIQLNAYATHVQRTSGRNTPIQLRHVYYNTKNKLKVDATEVAANTTPESVERVWEGVIVPLTQEIVNIRSNPSANFLDIEGKGALNGHCNAYGGCRHREKCGISQTSSFAQFGSGGTMSDPKNNPLMAKLQAAAAAKAAMLTGDAAQAAAGGGLPVGAGYMTGAPVTVADTVSSLVAERAAWLAAGAPTVTVADVAAEIAAARMVPPAPLPPTENLLPPDAPPRAEPDAQAEAAAIIAAEAAAVAAKPAGKTKGKAAAVKETCPACRKPVVLEDGRIKDHYGVDAKFQPDKSAQCVTSGDTMDEASAWVARQQAPKDGAVVYAADHPTQAPAANRADTGVIITATGVPITSDDPDRFVRKVVEAFEAAATSPPVETPHPDVTPVTVEHLDATFVRVDDPEILRNAVKAAADRIEELEIELAELARKYDQAAEATAIRVESLVTELATERTRIVSLGIETTKTQIKLDEATIELNQLRSRVLTPIGNAARPGTTILLDCYPVHGAGAPPTLFDVWIAPVLVAAAEAGDVLDYELIDYKSKAALAVSLRDHVKVNGLPEVLYVSSRSRAWAVAQEVLTPLAQKVITRTT